MTKREQNMNRIAPVLQSIRSLKESVAPGGVMYLFGSQARGDSNEDSDWDFLLLIDKDHISMDDFEQYVSPFIDLGWDMGQYFSVKLYTASDWQDRQGTPFYKNVTRDGIVI